MAPTVVWNSAKPLEEAIENWSDMTEYDKCQNLTRLTQRPRGRQNSTVV